jgi:hypothetical protein
MLFQIWKVKEFKDAKSTKLEILNDMDILNQIGDNMVFYYTYRHLVFFALDLCLFKRLIGFIPLQLLHFGDIPLLVAIL